MSRADEDSTKTFTTSHGCFEWIQWRFNFHSTTLTHTHLRWTAPALQACTLSLGFTAPPTYQPHAPSPPHCTSFVYSCTTFTPSLHLPHTLAHRRIFPLYTWISCAALHFWTLNGCQIHLRKFTQANHCREASAFFSSCSQMKLLIIPPGGERKTAFPRQL